MKPGDNTAAQSGNFHLSKWFLDFVGADGTTMIFYSAKLGWHGLSANYTSWLNYHPASGVHLKSRFRNVQIPQRNDKMITWSDSKFGVSGSWESLSEMIQTHIFDSEDGYLDWRCYQPASKVQLKINDCILEGRGYAEQLILTVPPWKIPMDELRWGRFGSDQSNIVWIELREKERKHWLWLNGEKMDNCIVEDDKLSIPGKNLNLYLDRGAALESEKKIFSVVEKLIRYLPGFNKIMPLNFLMADETKWLSKGELQTKDRILANGWAIHEMVNFKPVKP